MKAQQNQKYKSQGGKTKAKRNTQSVKSHPDGEKHSLIEKRRQTDRQKDKITESRKEQTTLFFSYIIML